MNVVFYKQQQTNPAQYVCMYVTKRLYQHRGDMLLKAEESFHKHNKKVIKTSHKKNGELNGQLQMGYYCYYYSGRFVLVEHFCGYCNGLILVTQTSKNRRMQLGFMINILYESTICSGMCSFFNFSIDSEGPSCKSKSHKAIKVSFIYSCQVMQGPEEVS